MPFEPPSEPGFCFSEGRLRIFQEREIMVIRGWPDPVAVVKTANRPIWHPFQPAIRLVAPYRRARTAAPRSKSRSPQGDRGESVTPSDAPLQLAFDFPDAPLLQAPKRQRGTRAQRRKRAFDGFRFSLPKQVAGALEPFRSHQWPLLLLLRFDPDALDLAGSNAVLAYLAAQHLGGEEGNIRRIQIGRLKQREILGVLQLPQANALVRLLRKLQPQSVTGENWRRLLEALRSADGDIRRRLSHLDRVNAGVLEILLDPSLADASGNRLLEEVSADRRENYRADIARLLAQVLTMQEELQQRRPVRKFRDLAHLRDVHEGLAEDHRRLLARVRQVRHYARQNFQRPPLPGVSGKILPLTSPEQLIEEGQVQCNCVASYASDVEKGHTFIYRVLEPERATLSVVRDPDGGWGIGELKARYNDEVRPATRRSIERWLNRYRLSV